MKEKKLLLLLHMADVSVSFWDLWGHQSQGELGSFVQFLVMFLCSDFLNLSGGFSGLGTYSASRDFVYFPVLNPFLPEIPRIACIF